MMQHRDNARMRREFRKRQGIQFLSIAVALLLIVLLALVQKRPDLFGEISKKTIAGLQLIVIAAFIGVTLVNWRCPACRKYLGPDINRAQCKKCGFRLR